MNKIRKERLEKIISRDIAEIINFESNNPDLSLISVTGVDLSNDGSYAKVYISANKENKALESLNNAKGFIRSSLAKKLDIKKTPELNFVIDKSFTSGNRIEELLNDINKKEN